jgi:hypothetical protein
VNGRKAADEALLLALACGATVENAARSASLSERTVFRRLDEPEFRRRLQRMRDEMAQRTTASLTAAGLEAVRTLVDLLQSTKPPAVRLGAARGILELGVRLREASELTERISSLEEQVRNYRHVPA